MKILLNKQKSKVSTNINNTLPTNLVGGKRLLPTEPIVSVLDEYDEYLKERGLCTQIRLTCSVNAICSNVLFNNVTEIVLNEGDDNVSVFNQNGYDGPTSLLYGDKGRIFKTTSNHEVLLNKAISDTQLTRPTIGYKYHCGADIFNNHTLRSLTFKSISPCKTANDNFNTLGDLARDYNGTQINFYKDTPWDKDKLLPMHVYLNEEIMTYEESKENNLIEENGWFGFKNVSKFPMFSKDGNRNVKYDFMSTINYLNGCDFVDMAPERDLYSFVPKYNKFKNRVEKNWNYCITYPSSSTTDIDFINRVSNSLKAMYFDDRLTNNGKTVVKIYSVSKHGLKKGDKVNIYLNSLLKLQNSEVVEIEDEYIFYAYRNNERFSKQWLDIEDENGNKLTTFNINNVVYTTNDFRVLKPKISSKPIYYIIEQKSANIDDDAQNLSYKKVVDGKECEYYVRIFTKLPNWRFAHKTPTEYEIYKDVGQGGLINTYNSIRYEFENTVGQMAFARNIYSDTVGEVVFNDSIDFKNLRDNLGRPLTSLYFTIIKNNAGYREWYGKNIDSPTPTAATVEYSHMFGKVSCAFELSKESVVNSDYHPLVNIISEKCNGLAVSIINNNRGDNIENDEIEYNKYGSHDGDRNFYGDLVCYSKFQANEEVIQPIYFRFNTAQRDVTNAYASYKDYGFRYTIKDEIAFDDYDANPFEVIQGTIENVVTRNEGYVYTPHFEIPINTFSSNVRMSYPTFYPLKNMINDEGKYIFKVNTNNGVQKGQVFFLYDKRHKVRYRGEIEKVISINKFQATLLTYMGIDNQNKSFVRVKCKDSAAYGRLSSIDNISYIIKYEGGKYNEEDVSIKTVLKKNVTYEIGIINGIVDNQFNDDVTLVGYMNIEGYANDIEGSSYYDSMLDALYYPNDASSYKLYFIDSNDIPSYATFMNDGSCRYLWRDIIANGFDTDSSIEQYPFTNGHLYVNKNIDLFLKRQDPFMIGEGIASDDPFSKVIKKSEINYYYNEDEIEC